MVFAKSTLLCLPVLLAALIPSSSVRSADLLTVGSDAPPLNIEHWVQDGKGKFKPVTKFEKGKVYVVEFWATWCPPCIASMPHLAQLQAEYADKGVQVVSISDEDLSTVERFLAREVPSAKEADANAKKQTYRELTSAYCLTTDPDGSSSTDYMQAAAVGGIPTAFIVGKDSKVEWIGHPMEMDQPLAAVVDGKWDRAAFLAELNARKEAEQLIEKISGLVQRKKFEEAVALIDETLQKRDDMQLRMIKLQVLLMGGKTEQVKTYAAQLLKELAGKPDLISIITWNMYDIAARDEAAAEAIVPMAITATEGAIEKLAKDAKGSALDTLAHLLMLKGETAKAIAIEEQAIELASAQDKPFMKQFLEQLKAGESKKK